MRSPFPGFPQAGIDFFRGLSRHNNREWFLPRKALFEENVKLPMRNLVEALNAEFARTDPEHVTDPGKAVYRFYRDTRFSEDKTPYKDQIAATFPRRGLARHEGASYYCAVSHKAVAVGGGVYMPTPETLAAIRRHLASRPDEFKRIVASPALRRLFGEMQGDRLTRTPKGFACDHPAADLLRFKQFLFYDELAPDIATKPALFEEIRKRFQAMKPFIAFLNAPLVAVRKQASARSAFLK